MAKRSNRRLQYRKDQAGCIWGFISIFDFRNGRATRKLLSNRRHITRQNIGAGCSVSELQLLTNFSTNTLGQNDGEERDSMRADSSKASSVKELMEEEMFGEPNPKKPTDDVEVVHIRDLKNNRSRRNSKTSSSSSDFRYESDGAKQNLLGNLELEAVLKELCQQIHQRSSSCTRHDENEGTDTQSVPTRLAFDENLIEAVKVLVGVRFTDAKDSKSKEFVDALQTLRSNKELLSDLLKDPDSLLVKHIENLEDARLDSDGSSNSSTKSNFLDPEPSLPRKQHHSFFRRRTKSLLEGHEKSQIVVLSPRDPVAEAKVGSPSRTEATVSHFSFAELKRKLKNAMGRDRHAADLSTGGPKGGWNFPNIDRFRNERFARPPVGVTSKDDDGIEPRETDASTGKETVASPKKRVSSIYVEGRKHLSELMSNGCESEEFSSLRSPKTLGKILLLPEFNYSPICSPRIEKEHSFVTAEQNPDKRSQVVNEILVQLSKENRLSLLGSPRGSSNSLPYYGETSEEKVQSREAQSDGKVENNRANTNEEVLCSIEAEENSEGDLVVAQTSDAVVDEEDKDLDVSAEQSGSSDIRDDQSCDVADVSKEEELAECLESDSNENDAKLLSSPSTPTPATSDKQHRDIDSTDKKPEWTSPVSVLEPLFSEEEDISPPGIKSKSVLPEAHQMRVPYDEQPSSNISKQISIGASLDDEESPLEYVEAVLLSTDLNWEEFLARWTSSDPVLDPSLFDEVALFSSRSLHDQRLLFDCTNEVLEEVCERYFGCSPWVSFVKSNVRPVPKKTDLIAEVWEGVEWRLRPLPSPRTLDQIVRKDLSRNGSWMDLRSGVESVGVDVGLAIFEELVAETLWSFIHEYPEADSVVA